MYKFYANKYPVKYFIHRPKSDASQITATIWQFEVEKYNWRVLPEVSDMCWHIIWYMNMRYKYGIWIWRYRGLCINGAQWCELLNIGTNDVKWWYMCIVENSAI